LLVVANEHYANSRYEEAAQLYQMLVDSGYQNVAIYYNLGISFFKMNQVPHAILNYERAHLLDPNDEDIEFNLEMARTFTVDRIEPLPEFFLVSWYRSVRGVFSSNTWAIISILLFAVTLVLSLFFWFSRVRSVKRLSFSIAIVALSLSMLTILFSKQEKLMLTQRNQAIIFQPVVAVKSSPGESGKDIFILHAGTKVKITKVLGDWVEVRIADGNKGWVQSVAVELI
jgi:tetratricopeptide (TPR) repeat protein